MTGRHSREISAVGFASSGIVLVAALPLEWLSAETPAGGTSLTGLQTVVPVLVSALCALALLGLAILVWRRGSRAAALAGIGVGLMTVTFVAVVGLSTSVATSLLPDLADRTDVVDVGFGAGLWLVLGSGLCATASGALALVPARSAGTSDGVPSSSKAEAVLRRLAGEDALSVAAAYGIRPDDLERWRDQFVRAGRRSLTWYR
jgi:hypothetical protein